jgi:peptide-methionine (R)-S-oxide reductase
MTDFKMPSEEELKARLTPEEYEVLRNKGTELPYTGDFLTKTPEGTFVCKVCGQPLFESTAKYDSMTGWPSFDQAIPGAVEEVMEGAGIKGWMEIICSRCKSHLGHVFDDGPITSTGKRYCLNSVCLNLDESKKPAPRAPETKDTEETTA